MVVHGAGIWIWARLAVRRRRQLSHARRIRMLMRRPQHRVIHGLLPIVLGIGGRRRILFLLIELMRLIKPKYALRQADLGLKAPLRIL